MTITLSPNPSPNHNPNPNRDRNRSPNLIPTLSTVPGFAVQGGQQKAWRAPADYASSCRASTSEIPRSFSASWNPPGARPQFLFQRSLCVLCCQAVKIPFLYQASYANSLSATPVATRKMPELEIEMCRNFSPGLWSAPKLQVIGGRVHTQKFRKSHNPFYFFTECIIIQSYTKQFMFVFGLIIFFKQF